VENLRKTDQIVTNGQKILNFGELWPSPPRNRAAELLRIWADLSGDKSRTGLFWHRAHSLRELVRACSEIEILVCEAAGVVG
jgi:hypothetical protein